MKRFIFLGMLCSAFSLVAATDSPESNQPMGAAKGPIGRQESVKGQPRMITGKNSGHMQSKHHTKLPKKSDKQ
ncbi:MAG: hypothetical protein WCP39_02700 [Chlamydiota bacterium]